MVGYGRKKNDAKIFSMACYGCMTSFLPPVHVFFRKSIKLFLLDWLVWFSTMNVDV